MAKSKLIFEELINRALHENSYSDQARNKRARLNTPESDHVDDMSDIESLVFSEELQKAIGNDIINPSQALDVVRRGESRLSIYGLNPHILEKSSPSFLLQLLIDYSDF